jgi:hypothetical protein
MKLFRVLAEGGSEVSELHRDLLLLGHATTGGAGRHSPNLQWLQSLGPLRNDVSFLTSSSSAGPDLARGAWKTHIESINPSVKQLPLLACSGAVKGSETKMTNPGAKTLLIRAAIHIHEKHSAAK